jgi:hypothetical protein
LTIGSRKSESAARQACRVRAQKQHGSKVDEPKSTNTKERRTVAEIKKTAAQKQKSRRSVDADAPRQLRGSRCGFYEIPKNPEGNSGRPMRYL